VVTPPGRCIDRLSGGSVMTDLDVADKAIEVALPHTAGFTLPETALSRALEPIVRTIGQIASWLWLVLMLVIVLQVALRYLFGIGSIMLEEVQWHLYGIGFVIGLSYCVLADRHVRIDVLAERLTPRTRARIEIFGLLILLLPFAVAVVVEAIPYVYRSWQLGETSAAPGGLPHRWIPKAFIVVGFGLIVVAALARLSRVLAFLRGGPAPRPA
jgi:TRAP-type mannitol/chloroaromatic compound transport system permease small subunit